MGGQGVYVKEVEWDKYNNGSSTATSSITKKVDERTGGKRTRGQLKAAVQEKLASSVDAFKETLGK